MKEFKSVAEVEERLSEIANEINGEGADLEALETEINELESRKKEIEDYCNKQEELRKKVEKEGTVMEKFTETNNEVRYDASSKEYRSAYLKDLAEKIEGRSIFGEMTKEERSAFVFTTSNTGAVVPTITLDRVKELVSSMAPMYDDATKSAIAEGFRLARHTGITQGDAATTLEGIANDDEIDTFDYLSLAGVEIKKHADVTRKMRFQSIDAFEDWLVNHIALRILVAKDKVILARLDDATYGIAAANKVNGEYTDATIRGAFAKIKSNGVKVVYANNKTIYEGLAGIETKDGYKVFTPSAMVDPITQGSLYGARVKLDDNIADDVAYIGVPADILANNFDDYAFTADENAKSWVTTYSGYSLFDAGLENPYAFVKVTFGTASV